MARTHLAAPPWPRSSARFNDGQTPPLPDPIVGGTLATKPSLERGQQGMDPAPSMSPGLKSGSTRGPPCTQHLGVAPSSTTLAGWDPRDGAPTSAPQLGSEDRTCPRTPGAHTCPATPRDSVSPFFKGSCSPPNFGLRTLAQRGMEEEGWGARAHAGVRPSVPLRPRGEGLLSKEKSPSGGAGREKGLTWAWERLRASQMMSVRLPRPPQCRPRAAGTPPASPATAGARPLRHPHVPLGATSTSASPFPPEPVHLGLLRGVFPQMGPGGIQRCWQGAAGGLGAGPLGKPQGGDTNGTGAAGEGGTSSAASPGQQEEALG